MNEMIETGMNFLNATKEQLPRIVEVEIYNQSNLEKMATADLKSVKVESRIYLFEAYTTDHRPLWFIEEHGKVVGWFSFRDFLWMSSI